MILFQPCVKTTTVTGDGIDNDCDGLIDEELCTVENKKKGSVAVNCVSQENKNNVQSF